MMETDGYRMGDGSLLEIHPRRTNGDAIRAMSDEEIGKLFGPALLCDGNCPASKWDCEGDERPGGICDHRIPGYECPSMICRWLQQEEGKG
jgi:hypothetical protein